MGSQRIVIKGNDDNISQDNKKTLDRSNHTKNGDLKKPYFTLDAAEEAASKYSDKIAYLCQNLSCGCRRRKHYHIGTNKGSERAKVEKEIESLQNDIWKLKYQIQDIEIQIFQNYPGMKVFFSRQYFEYSTSETILAGEYTTISGALKKKIFDSSIYRADGVVLVIVSPGKSEVPERINFLIKSKTYNSLKELLKAKKDLTNEKKLLEKALGLGKYFLSGSFKKNTYYTSLMKDTANKGMLVGLGNYNSIVLDLIENNPDPGRYELIKPALVVKTKDKKR